MASRSDLTGQIGHRVNSWEQLPLIDPDYLIVERRPAWLDAYARGLLRHLLAIRAGEKARGYSIVMIRSATAWLIESYAAARIPPAPEAAQLIHALLRPNPNSSTSPVRRSSEPAYWVAIRFEADHPLDPNGKEPSQATLYAVAKHVRPQLQNRYASQKTAEGTVRGWRRLSHYRDNVGLQRRAPLE